MHIFVQIFFCFFPLHLCRTLLLSLLVHVSSSSAAQSFGDGEGAVPRARPPLISGSIFTVASKASGIVDGATASTQLSTLRAASRHLESGMLIICVNHIWGSNHRRLGSSKGVTVCGLGFGLSRVSGLGQGSTDRLAGLGLKLGSCCGAGCGDEALTCMCEFCASASALDIGSRCADEDLTTLHDSVCTTPFTRLHS